MIRRVAELQSCGVAELWCRGAVEPWNSELANLLCCRIVVLYKSSGYDVFIATD